MGLFIGVEAGLGAPSHGIGGFVSEINQHISRTAFSEVSLYHD